jgi:hypothetical protein
MRTAWFMAAAVTAAVVAVTTFDLSGARQPKVEPPKADPAKTRIVPLVLVRPGESKDLLLCSRCTVGLNRSAGLRVGETRDGRLVNEAKVWRKCGVTVEVPDFQAGEKAAAAPVYAPLRKQGLDVFVARITAATDAAPGVYDLHIADETCSGTCDTDFRILVVAP